MKQFQTRAEPCHGKGKQRKDEGSLGQSSGPIAPKQLVPETVCTLPAKRKQLREGASSPCSLLHPSWVTLKSLLEAAEKPPRACVRSHGSAATCSEPHSSGGCCQWCRKRTYGRPRPTVAPAPSDIPAL